MFSSKLIYLIENFRESIKKKKEKKTWFAESVWNLLS